MVLNAKNLTLSDPAGGSVPPPSSSFSSSVEWPLGDFVNLKL